MALMSQRAYARHRAERGLPGGTLRAVQKAIAAGRIQLTPDGLIDPDAADAAWEANSSSIHRRHKTAAAAGDPTRSRATEADGGNAAIAPRSKAQPRTKAAASPTPVEPSSPSLSTVPALPTPDEIPSATPGMPLAEAQALEKVWKAKLAELKYQERSGQLVRAEEVAARWAEIITLSKTKLLAIPAAAKNRIPHLTAADVGVLDELIREALEELADTEVDGGDDDS